MFPRHRVLIVDDEPVVRLLFQRSLQAARFEVILAENGEAGLKILREDPTIGLVLLDLKMPGMDGWAFLRAQREDPQLAAVPTVILSGSPADDDQLHALQAADILLKPVARNDLIRVVSTYCKPLAD